MWSAIRLILGWLIFLFLGCVAIVIAPGGAINFKFFINAEAMLLVFGGTILWGWMSWGLKGMFKAIIIAIKFPSFSSHQEIGSTPTSPPPYKGGESEGDAEKSRTVLSGLRNAALSIGMISTMLGVILMLGTIDDVARIPLKFAIAFS